MKNLVILGLGLMFCLFANSQDTTTSKKQDTTQLEEVIILSRRKLSNYRQEKTLSSLDDYLEKSNKITMIKRGNYAWEPSLNNMTTDRLSVTIDGMQIFGACTDRMDPITSYVDVSNLEKVTINSGQEGTENAHCVGGGVDLKLPASKYFGSGFKTSFDLGYETNGNYKTTGLDLEYSGNKFYANVDGIYRKSDNYDAGNNKEILYSQFNKYNFSVQTGYKLSEKHSIDANIIYDRATDVGYPGLPMDVSLAEALITSVTHQYKTESNSLESIESKLYYNTITHVMDDSKRPDVPIRMDMPGWSDTYGFYSKAILKANKHNLILNLNGFYNRSLAEMTMYPADTSQSAMFMYTWPDIRTLYTGIYAKDEYTVNNKATLSTSIRLGLHNNRIAKETGLESLQIFYPEISDTKSRFLTSVSANYQFTQKPCDFNVGIGYGERAPSVSEGYGFFLFNNFDNYDYVGNPTLDKEKAIEANISANYQFNNFKVGIESSYFHIMDYIIGEIDSSLSAMTIGANGVRIYKSLDYANIFDVYLNSSYKLSKSIAINGSIGYNYGRGSNNENLPLIKPISYIGEISYNKPKFNIALQVDGNATQNKFSRIYGEDKTPSYTVLNLNLGNSFFVKDRKMILKYGIENILDKSYSTYSDWNNILRQGRNFYINASYIIN